MEWLKEILGENVTEEQMEKINKEFPKHAIPKDQYNKKVKDLEEKSSELETAKETLEQLNKKVDGLKNLESKNEELNKKVEEISGEYNNYKEEADSRIEQIRKKTAAKDLLIQAKAEPNLSKLLLKEVDLEKVKLSEDGKVANPDDILNPLKENYKNVFPEETVTGDKPTSSTGKSSSTSSYKAKYDKAMKNGNRREAIKIKQEAFSKGEVI